MCSRKNEKLRDRARRIVRDAAGVDDEAAAELLTDAGDVRTAILMAKLGVPRETATTFALGEPDGSVRKALEWKNSLIEGGRDSKARVRASGSKNAALPILAACVLTDEPIMLHRIPRVRDIRTMEKLMAHIGVTMTKEPNGPHHIQCDNLAEPDSAL